MMSEVVNLWGGVDSIAWLDRWRESQLKLIARATATEMARMLEAHSCSDQQLSRRLLFQLIAQMELLGRIPEGLLSASTPELSEARAEVQAWIPESIGRLEKNLRTALCQREQAGRLKPNNDPAQSGGLEAASR
jgi:hypothetical protein